MISSTELRVYRFYLSEVDGQKSLVKVNGVADCQGQFPGRFVALTDDGKHVLLAETIGAATFSTGSLERLLEAAEVTQILAGSELAAEGFNMPALFILPTS